MKRVPWTERIVKERIKKVLKKLDIWFFMPSANVFGRRGIPDFVCCMLGMFIGIEAKREDTGAKGLSPTQVIESRGILKNAGVYMVVWNEDTLETMEKKLRKIRGERWLRMWKN